MKTNKDCVFCQIAKKIGKDIVCIDPLNPVVKGHKIVFSKYHSKDFTDNLLITLKVMKAATEIAHAMGGDFNLITSKGKNATQSVFHLHIHLIPRKKGDGLKLPWTDQVKGRGKLNTLD